MLPGLELIGCAGLAVPANVMHHVVRVESSYNPYAIGVVGGRLLRQPKSLAEALATVRMLESKGYNFSLGLAQVNRYNLSKYGLDSYEKAFETCPNLQAGSRILAECYDRSGKDWGKSFSCYYSGNFTTGYRHGYVQKVYASMNGGGSRAPASPDGAIEVVSKPSRRVVEVTRYPLQSTQTPAQRRIIEAAVPPLQPFATPSPALANQPQAPAPAASLGDVAVASAMPQESQPVLVNAAPSAVPQRPPLPPPAADEAFVF